MKQGLGWSGLLLLGILVNANAAFADPLSVSVGCASEAHVWYPVNGQTSWTAYPSGGTPPYTYKWWHGSTLLTGTNQTFTAILYASNYDDFNYIPVTAVVRDSLGQTATGSCTTGVFWHAESEDSCWYYGPSGEIIYC